MQIVEIHGGTFKQRWIATKVIDWCFENRIVNEKNLGINLSIVEGLNCWGSCEDGEPYKEKYIAFDIEISNEQSIRDFISTIMHEMVHVNQFATGVFDGDGEREAESREYELADRFLRETRS